VCLDVTRVMTCRVLKTAVRTSSLAGKKTVMLLRSVLCYCEVCYVTAKCVVLLQSVMLPRSVLLMRSVSCECEVCYGTAKCVMLL